MASDEHEASKAPTTYREEAALYLGWVRARWERTKSSWRESPQWSKMIATLYISMYIAMYIVILYAVTNEYDPARGYDVKLDLTPLSCWLVAFFLSPFALLMWMVMLPAVPYRKYIVSRKFPFLRWGYFLVAGYAAMFSMFVWVLLGGGKRWFLDFILHGEAIAFIATVAFAVIAPRLGVSLEGDTTPDGVLNVGGSRADCGDSL